MTMPPAGDRRRLFLVPEPGDPCNSAAFERHPDLKGPDGWSTVYGRTVGFGTISGPARGRLRGIEGAIR